MVVRILSRRETKSRKKVSWHICKILNRGSDDMRVQEEKPNEPGARELWDICSVMECSRNGVLLLEWQQVGPYFSTFILPVDPI